LFVKAGSLFSILDGVIIECDSTGVWLWYSSFCDGRWDVFDCSLSFTE
jgi:hypothetical protein